MLTLLNWAILFCILSSCIIIPLDRVFNKKEVGLLNLCKSFQRPEIIKYLTDMNELLRLYDNDGVVIV